MLLNELIYLDIYFHSSFSFSKIGLHIIHFTVIAFALNAIFQYCNNLIRYHCRAQKSLDFLGPTPSSEPKKEGKQYYFLNAIISELALSECTVITKY